LKLAFVIEQNALSGGGYFHTLNSIQVIASQTTEHDEIMVMADSPEQDWASLDFNKCFYVNNSDFSFIQFLQEKLELFGADLVFYLTPSPTPKYIRHFPYVYTIWDLGRFDLPAFPEYSHISPFESNHEIYRTCVQSAVACFIPDVNLKKKVSSFFNIPLTRIIILPLSQNPNLPSEIPSPIGNRIEGQIFYPAQFWPHKNHVRLVQALAHLINSGENFNVIFSGTDKGSLENVKKYVKSHDLNDRVDFLGFIPDNQVAEAYLTSELLVLPSYLGPNIMPVYEGWSYQIPVIASSAFADCIGDAGVIFDPDSVTSLASAIMLGRLKSSEIVAQGKKRLQENTAIQIESKTLVKELLRDFKIKRENWTF
jgi:glycosyltransferase involved in cell wall biosynthesis